MKSYQSMKRYITQIEDIWDNTDTYLKNEDKLRQANKVLHIVTNLLDTGKERACFKDENGWQVNTWVKKAILLLFKLSQNEIISLGSVQAYDKISPRFNPNWEEEDFARVGARIVPGAYVRSGVFLGNNVVVMPSFINIGAYIDHNTMIDSMATVGSCAQIGENCHIASSVTIGGVLEPITERPVIIENNCFIGAGSQISEGVIVHEGSVIGSGVILSGSTKIYNRDTNKILYGTIPPYSVVVPGILPTQESNKPSLMCAVIVKTVDKETRRKTTINEMLRA
jgi:2,3,4,5-tetrahydropyridine-2-carboxylate N-succinyltransferase